MVTPDARPAGETALSAAEAERDVVLAMYDYKQAAESGAVLAAAQLYSDLFSAIRRYGTAIKAEVRAALLAGAPTVWVATNRHGARVSPVSMLYHGDPAMRDGVATNDNEDDGLYLWSLPQLTPPGTVRRYALVPLPEEGTP